MKIMQRSTACKTSKQENVSTVVSLLHSVFLLSHYLQFLLYHFLHTIFEHNYRQIPNHGKELNVFLKVGLFLIIQDKYVIYFFIHFHSSRIYLSLVIASVLES